MPLKYNQIIGILNDYWFVLDRTNWSHSRYEKEGHGITVWFHKEYPKKTAKSMLTDVSAIVWVDYKDLIGAYNIKL